MAPRKPKRQTTGRKPSTQRAGTKPKSQTGSRPTTRASSKPTTQTGNKPTTRSASKPTTQTGNKPTTRSDSKPKTQTAGTKPKSQAGDKKPTAPRASGKPKTQTDDKRPTTRRSGRKTKNQTENREPEIQTAARTPETQTADNRSKAQTPDEERRGVERYASEDLVVLEPDPKTPKIFLKLKFGKPLIKPSRRVSEIIAAIYWDINNICFVQALMWQRNDRRYFPHYESQSNEAQKLVRMAIDYMTKALSPAEKKVREVRNIARFVRNLGWRIFAICAWAEGFRRACLQETNPAVWIRLINIIRANSESLAYFARARNLDWRGLLLQYSNHPIPEIKPNLKWVYKRIGKEHPHHFVRTSSGGLRKTIYQRRLQEHIDECIFNPANWVIDGQQLENPTIRQEKHGPCDMCGSSERCKCAPGRLVAGLVELVDYPIKGAGVRALANFKKGELLAEYVGELRLGYYDDAVYGLYLQTLVDDNFVLAAISSQFKGNWTRFLNHSCNPSTDFTCRTIGNRVLMTVEAIRDIPIFEEITVSYGINYWRVPGRRCQCGEPNCISK